MSRLLSSSRNIRATVSLRTSAQQYNQRLLIRRCHCGLSGGNAPTKDISGLEDDEPRNEHHHDRNEDIGEEGKAGDRDEENHGSRPVPRYNDGNDEAPHLRSFEELSLEFYVGR
jgi:hypothetical protein